VYDEEEQRKRFLVVVIVVFGHLPAAGFSRGIDGQGSARRRELTESRCWFPLRDQLLPMGVITPSHVWSMSCLFALICPAWCLLTRLHPPVFHSLVHTCSAKRRYKSTIQLSDIVMGHGLLLSALATARALEGLAPAAGLVLTGVIETATQICEAVEVILSTLRTQSPTRAHTVAEGKIQQEAVSSA
jgi:hypothetical protein